MGDNLKNQLMPAACPPTQHLTGSRRMGIMTTPENREHALEAVKSRTAHLVRVQELAHIAIKDAGNLRARAVKDALQVFSAKELAAEMGVSVQRVYGLARESDQG